MDGGREECEDGGGCEIFGGRGAARLLGLEGCWGRALWIAANTREREGQGQNKIKL